jgi:hypothetical protein
MYGALVAQQLGIPDLGLMLLKVLAVAGAAALGAIGSGLALQLCCRLAVHRSPPRSAVMASRGLGAVLFGLLVWLWVFSPAGAGGLGGGGGWWPFGGAGGSSGSTTTTSATTSKNGPAVDAKTNGRQQTVRVRLLGGRRVKDQRFYLLEDETEARTWPELRDRLSERQDSEKAAKSLEIVVYRDSVDKDSPAVVALRTWAEERGLTVKMTFPPEDMP